MAELTKVGLYLPTITLWNRLEGRPRTVDFDRALRAEVRDALWMISKQWQMGEFIGDDAGSPVLAKALLETTRLTKYQAGSEPAEPLSTDVPLEVTVENRPIAFRRAGRDISLDIRLLMGRQWLRLVEPVGPGMRAAYIAQYGIAKPDPASPADAHICAHSTAWQQFSAAGGRCMDGYALLEHLEAAPGNTAHDGIAAADTQQKRDDIDALVPRWIEWFRRLVEQPVERANPSWQPEALEHRFACAAPWRGGEKVLIAEEYFHGHLDWYNLDIDPTRATLDGDADAAPDPERFITRTFVPTSVTFGGMPHPRWWTFEDWKTNLGFVRPDTTDLNKLLLLDFMLIFANDWFVLPVTLPVGGLTEVHGLVVTNVFGEQTWVQAAGRGADEDWQRWNMYTMAVHGNEDVPADMATVLLPVAAKVQESKPLEEIHLLRDEIANMVWGVETRVPLPTGRGHTGSEAGYEFRGKLQQLVFAAHPPGGGPPLEPVAPIRYQIVNSVPEHWVPFVPVHRDTQMREIQLQRASMPRILENDPDVPRKVEPRTSLLREGLDEATPRPYFVHEEEVTRAGITVRLSWQRTRGPDGRVHTWLGIRKQTGRGGGSSGLAFDRILPVKPAGG
jgi:hypothetical protein